MFNGFVLIMKNGIILTNYASIFCGHVCFGVEFTMSLITLTRKNVKFE